MSDVREKLILKYGKTFLAELDRAPITAHGYRTSEPDVQEYLLNARAKDVDAALSATQLEAANEKLTTRLELTDFYTACRNGEYSATEISKWLAANFEDDFEAFNRDFPQVAAEQVPSNMSAITADLSARRVYPIYAELVTSFGRLAVPDKGYPSLTLKCGNEYLTGKPLRDYIRSHPLEMLEPQSNQARPAHEKQSATEFLATDPVLRSVKTEQPLLLRERFNREWGNFLASDIGRSLKARGEQHGLGSFLPGWMWEYMVKNQTPLHQRGFEQAALAVAAKITVHEGDNAAPLVLTHDAIGGAKSGVTTIHDGGGDHHKQIPLGLTTAGQSVPSPYNPHHEWTEQSLRRELRRLTADQYKERLGDVAFVRALDKFKMR